MSSDMFFPEIFGGFLIGLASALPLLLEGRIAGISGYASSAMRPKSNDGKTGLMFVLGLIVGGVIWYAFFTPTESANIGASTPFWVWVIAGFAVGLGSRLSGGCTSGHGVCGMARISKRSFVSVGIFMAVAIIIQSLWKGVL